jgi:hypothetical protein
MIEFDLTRNRMKNQRIKLWRIFIVRLMRLYYILFLRFMCAALQREMKRNQAYYESLNLWSIVRYSKFGISGDR